MIHYRESNMAEGHEYVMKVIQDHYEEVKPPVLPETINLDITQIIQLEAAKAFVSVIAEEDGEIKGVCSGYVHPHMHYKGVMFASTSFLQAHKSLGKKRVRVVKELVKKFEEVCSSKFNVEYVQVTLSSAKDIRRIFPDYETTDIIISKKV